MLHAFLCGASKGLGVSVADRREGENVVPANDANKIPRPKPRWWKRTWFKVVVVLAIVCLGAMVFVAEYMIRHAEPLIRARVVDTLSARFHSPVELDHLGISLIKGVKIGSTGVEVEGDGLRIRYIAGPNQPQNDSNAPMLSVQHFAFHTRLRALLRKPTRIVEVSVQGMELHIPPKEMRQQILGPKDKRHQPMITLLVNHIRCKDVKLFIDTTKPGKDPMEFDIQKLDLQDVGQSQPFTYQAELINPKPIGEVHAAGHFGPWDADNPRETALDGSYNFSNADLSTIKGISGILSSHGQFSGVLDHITIDGETQTPDFALDVSDHPMPLHTVFHAYVDGTDGDTYLDPVQARLKNSDFTARGKVVLIKGQGHDIEMNVDVPHARMQDFLELSAKTRPPVMNAVLTMKAHLHIPPGDTRVPQKLELAGKFQLHDVRFNNPAIQDKVDGLSARAQGRPKEVAEVSTDKQAEVSSMMSATFSHRARIGERARHALPDSGCAGADERRVLDGRQSLRVQGACANGCDGLADGDRMEELAAEARGSVPEEERRRAGTADLDQRDAGRCALWAGAARHGGREQSSDGRGSEDEPAGDARECEGEARTRRGGEGAGEGGQQRRRQTDEGGEEGREGTQEGRAS